MIKENYFSQESKAVQLESFMQAADGVRSAQRKFALNADACALLVLDMQDYFLDPASHAYVPASEAVVPAVVQLQKTFLACRKPVIQTRHINTDQNAGSMARWWREVLTLENPRSAISAQLSIDDTPVLIKGQYDAFYNTALESILKDLAVTQVVISGVMTHLCCETTARSAFMRGFDVFFVADATATYNAQLHRATILNLAHGFAAIVSTGEILAFFGKINGGKK